MDEMHGSLIAYEMRIEKYKPLDKEATFKSHKNMKAKQESKEEETSNEMEANFVQKLKRGKGKYKGKLLFKCFNCGGIGHFVAKCPLNENNKSDEGSHQERSDQKKKTNFKKGNFKKKSFISKNLSS